MRQLADEHRKQLDSLPFLRRKECRGLRGTLGRGGKTS